MNKIVILVLMIFGIMSSCQKDKSISPSTSFSVKTQGNYSALQVGNYWVYQQFDLDSLGNTTPLNKFDSCYVEKDTLINGIVYYKYLSPRPYTTNKLNVMFLRDSLDYIVTNYGLKWFSSSDFSTVLFQNYQFIMSDTMCNSVMKMEPGNTNVVTPAGVFNTLNAQIKHSFYPNWNQAGSVRYSNRRHAENVGVVLETLPSFVNSKSYQERRLMRYHVN